MFISSCFYLLASGYRARISYLHCIKDGMNIDPPYNTGKDFVYKDDFHDSLENYKRITGQVDKDGNRLSTNAEASGRYHTDWLNMMYPRLRLARNLLTDDGVIFISIDDNEVDNLKKICNEVFGEDNFIGCAGRITKKSNNKGDFWAPNFDYLLTYTKNIVCAEPFFGGANVEAYNIVEEDGPRKGERYQLVRLYMSTIQNRNPEQRFWIDCPDGTRVIPPGKTFPPERPLLGDGIWRWTRTKFEAEKDKIVVKPVRSSNLVTEDGSPAKWNVFTKTYLQDVIDNSSAKPNSFIEDHINQRGSHELGELEIPFNYSKPSSLIRYLMEVCKVKDEDVVLDFFSGSATTADAVMQLNAEDGGNRKFIMVQLPETIDEKDEAYKAGFMNICEIGKERIRRVGEKIKEEKGLEAQNLDIGFKVLKLDTSNIRKWQPDYDNLEQSILDYVDNYVEGRTELDVVYEIMLKYGLDLTYSVDEFVIADKKVYSIGFGMLMICLDNEITTEVAKGILEKVKELVPETTRVVFKDNGFKTDSNKTNIKEILKCGGIEEFITL